MASQSFNGFPIDVVHFLHELSQNNDRAWFEANKHRYTEGVIANVPAFVEALGIRLQDAISPGITYDTRTNGAGSMMRIYRDTRFAKDKTPYKTNIAFAFWEGQRKKMQNPSFGFQFGTWGAGLYAGLWQFPKGFMQDYREAVVDERKGPRLVEAIAQVQAAGDYVIGGELYKRIPSGYDDESPRMDLLKRKGLYASSPQLDIELVTKPELVDVCLEHCINMAPIQQWEVRVDTLL